MGFKTDFSEATETSGIKPEGDYECTIKKIEERTTKNGKMGLNFTFEIRKDVPGQKYGGGLIFNTIWKKKEPNEQDKAVEGYNFGQLMAVGKAAQVTDGKDYTDVRDYCNDLLYRNVLITLKHESNPNFKSGEPQERVSKLSPSKIEETANESFTDDDGVPF